jgi:hypothetical protein
MYCLSLEISPLGTSLQREKYGSVGHTVDCSVYGIQKRFSFAPLLYYDNKHIFRIRSIRTIALLKKDSSKFYKYLALKICILSFS